MMRAPFVATAVLLLTASMLFAQDVKPKDQPSSRVWEYRGSVLALAFTRDGERLVSGGASKSGGVAVWDVKTGRRLLNIKNAGLVFSLALSPDGKRIATAGYTGVGAKDPKARFAVFDAHNGKELFTLKNITSGERPCIAWSPDGKLLAAGTFVGADEDAVGALQLFDADTGKALGAPLVGPSEGFGRLVFAPDGKTLAAASWGQGTFVVLWDVETRKQRAVLKSKKTWALIRSLAFSADGKQLVWASGNEVNGNAEHLLWDVPAGRRIASLRTEAMMAALFFEAGGTLLNVELGGDIHRWDLSTLKKSASTEVELAWPTMVQAAALSPDGTTLAIGTGSSDALAPPMEDVGTIRLFDARTGRERLSPEKELARARAEADESARLAEAAKKKARRDEEIKLELARLSPEVRAKLGRASAAAPRLLYAVHMNQAQLAVERGQFATARTLLAQHQPRPGQDDVRGFEWHYLWRQCGFKHVEMENPDPICASWQGAAPCLSPDGKTLAVATTEHEVVLWDAADGKERAVLRGSSGPIWHFSFSPEGKYLASAGGKERSPLITFPPTEEKDDPSWREAILWDAPTGKRVTTFDGSKIAIDCITFSRDGKALALGDLAGTVRVFDVPSGKLTGTLQHLDESPATLCFSPDGKALAVGGRKGAIDVWDLATRKRTSLRVGKDKKVIIALAFDPTGSIIYSTEGDWPDNNTARRWRRDDKGAWSQTRTWPQVHRLAVAPDGKRVALSGWHGVALWDSVEDREIGRVVPRVSGNGLDSLLSFAADSKSLLVYADRIQGQPQLLLFDAAGGARLAGVDQLLPAADPVAVYLGADGKASAFTVGGARRHGDTVVGVHMTLRQHVHSREFTSLHGGFFGLTLSFSNDGASLAVTDSESVYVWDLRRDKNRKIYRANSLPIRDVRFSPDGKNVLASHTPGVRIWDIETAKEITLIATSYGTISADGKFVYKVNDDRSIAVFSSNTGKLMATLDKKEKPTEDSELNSHHVLHSPGGRWVVGLDDNLIDAVANTVVKRWQGDPLPVPFGFTPDEKTLVTTDRKGTLTVWDLPAVKERHVIAKLGAVGVAAFAPDNRTAALLLHDGAVVLFDLAAGSEIARLTGLSAHVTHMTFAPDGTSLATASADGTLRFWCPFTGVQRLSIRAHNGRITSLAFAPDGATLATAGDQTVRLWRTR